MILVDQPVFAHTARLILQELVAPISYEAIDRHHLDGEISRAVKIVLRHSVHVVRRHIHQVWGAATWPIRKPHQEVEQKTIKPPLVDLAVDLLEQELNNQVTAH